MLGLGSLMRGELPISRRRCVGVLLGPLLVAVSACGLLAASQVPAQGPSAAPVSTTPPSVSGQPSVPVPAVTPAGPGVLPPRPGSQFAEVDLRDYSFSPPVVTVAARLPIR